MSSGYYQKNKDFKKSLVKVIEIFLKKIKTNSKNMVVNDTKIFLKKEKTKSVKMLVK